jgi:phosphatidylserine decarboxylase
MHVDPPPAGMPTATPWRERAFLVLQYLLPRRRLSALVHRLARSRRPWLKNLLIRNFMRLFSISLDEAQVRDPRAFNSFNAFFTRAPAQGARPLPEDPTQVISPADGRLYHAAPLEGQRMLQAKGHYYSLKSLLAGHPRAEALAGGMALTIYLAPSNYHRVHMQLDGRLAAMSHVPGDLYSVNATTARLLPGLFTRNERVVCHFDTACGAVAVILVGALNVGSIETVWAGEITAWAGREVSHHNYATHGDGGIRLARGEELGRFNMGSTVILILPPGSCELAADLIADQPVRMGQPLARQLR